MRILLIIVTLLICLALNGCTRLKIKLQPEYEGIDRRVLWLYKEYMYLSAENNVTFYNPITIGFKDIGVDGEDGKVVGVCNYGVNFREIDLDKQFWEESSVYEKMALFFHEMTHCLCHRGHDYGHKKKYPATNFDRIVEALEWKIKGGPKPGRFDDGCPTSLMYPSVIDEDCFAAHYPEYVKEMFDRCKPW